MNKLRATACCALLLTTAPTLATSVYRCVNDAGDLTFTRHGCPANQAAEIQQALNPTPSSGKPVPLAKPGAQRKLPEEGSAKQLTVVGEQDDGCGNRVTGNARRSAMISQKILPGMTRADIDSTFGIPDSVTSRNGQVQYRYIGDKGRTQSISFDEHGCTRGKR